MRRVLVAYVLNVAEVILWVSLDLVTERFEERAGVIGSLAT